MFAVGIRVLTEWLDMDALSVNKPADHILRGADRTMSHASSYCLKGSSDSALMSFTCNNEIPTPATLILSP